MTLDIETALRETLSDRAQQLTPESDPWPKFIRDYRRHRRGRRARNAAAVAVGVAAMGLMGSGVVPLPRWVPALTIDNASSPLLDAPTVGSLAADEEWLSAFTARIPELLADTWEGDTDGQWKVDDVNDIKVIFAGDVYRQRLVAAYVPVRTGLLRSEPTVWFAGPIGADPEQMEQDSAGGEALTEPYVARVDGVENQADVLVLAAQGSRVEASGSVEYRADGTVDRTWTPVPRRESGEYLTRVPAISIEAVLLRVATPGSTAQTSRFDFGTWSPSYDQELELAIDAAAAEYSAAHRELGRTWAVSPIASLGLQPDQVDITVLWAGELDGETAMLLAVQPRNGGVILFSGTGGPVGDGGYGATDMLRLLAPADGAYARPYAWRLEASPSGNVFVVAPEGAKSAEIRLDDGTSIPVELDSTGAGYATADAERMTTVAFDATGEVMGETPVPPLEDDSSGVPGETPATSVVLNE